MNPSFGPRIWLVGQILPAILIERKGESHDAAIEEAIRMADKVLDEMSKLRSA
jgi:hypothetical protein